MSQPEHFEMLILGSGEGGKFLAWHTAESGHHTAVVERRPRRRGRRGGRRRRGGPEDGLAGSIADELGPTSVPESTSAVADFDGYAPEPYRPEPEPYRPAPEPVASQPELQHADQGQQEAPRAPAPAQDENAQDAERAAARRRSTVREKVSFMTAAQPEAQAAAPASVQPPSPEPAPQPAPEPAAGEQPRRAGWWSRAFGNGND